jgi:uncharacterized membrane protein YbhN (UPF0104 family)
VKLQLGARVWTLAARFAVSALVLLLVARVVDVATVLSRLAALSPAWVAVAFAVSVAQIGVLAWRWRLTAARLGLDLPLAEAVGEYWLGILLNQLLPGGVAGDASRAWRHARSVEVPGPAVRAVILERASAQVVMILTALLSLLLLPWGSAATRMVVGLVGLAAIGGAWVTLARLAPAGSVLGRLVAEARRAVLAREVIVQQSASALLVVASYVSVFLIAARAIVIDVPTATMLPLVAPVLMTMLIPVTIAGWGLREAAAAALWGASGLSPEDGAAISVAYGLLVLAASLPGALTSAVAARAGRDRRGRPRPE